jgi:dTDP-4-amino-4,6-dideoxygalactose transaminase
MMEFIDLQAQRHRLGDKIDRAIAGVLEHGKFIMGPEVHALEERLAAYCGVRHAVTCANGTDALVLALMALGARTDDAVFVPSFTFAATAEAVAFVGATPVFVDVRPDTFNMDAASLRTAVAMARELGLRPLGVLPVDLFGQPADYAALGRVAAESGMWVLGDAAQSFGATLRGAPVGSLALATTTSFFPAKPLGCYGDGGAVFTDDDGLASTMRSLRVHGQGTDKYDNVLVGMNGRLDTMQAAVLLQKLDVFDEERERRGEVAQRYIAGLRDVATVPGLLDGATSVWAQFTIALPGRDEAIPFLRERGIPTAVYYPRPLHAQTAYRSYPRASASLTTSEALSDSVLSLPMHPYLDEADQRRVITALQGLIVNGVGQAGVSQLAAR